MVTTSASRERAATAAKNKSTSKAYMVITAAVEN